MGKAAPSLGEGNFWGKDPASPPADKLSWKRENEGLGADGKSGCIACQGAEKEDEEAGPPVSTAPGQPLGVGLTCQETGPEERRRASQEPPAVAGKEHTLAESSWAGLAHRR